MLWARNFILLDTYVFRISRSRSGIKVTGSRSYGHIWNGRQCCFKLTFDVTSMKSKALLQRILSRCQVSDLDERILSNCQTVLSHFIRFPSSSSSSSIDHHWTSQNDDSRYNKITFKRTRSLSNAVCCKHASNVCACAVSALIRLPVVNLSLQMDSATTTTTTTTTTNVKI